MIRFSFRGAALGAALITLLAGAPAEAVGPQGDYGDAPEGAPAYPWIGIVGKFPTCFGGAYGFIRHQVQANAPLFLGPLVDYENDGNAGVCPPPPYQNDECHASVDDDAGIIVPTSYTLNAANQPIACTPGARTSLGPACGLGDWGVNLDFEIANTTNNSVYMNLVVDWNMDGQWGGTGACASGAFLEQILTDFVVPPNFGGRVSLLNPPPYRIGDRDGYVWLRVTLTDVPIGGNWDGNGRQASYVLGETEDYLVRVGNAYDQEGEFGDAPEGAPAYPLLGVIGNFPTCTSVGAAGSFIVHTSPTSQLRLGGSLDVEFDGNDGDCLWTAHNRDECHLAGGDAGFFGAAPQSISAGLLVACGGANGAPLGTPCSNGAWGTNGDLIVVNQTNAPGYLNVLVDWNQNGAWSGSALCPGLGLVPEWTAQNIGVPPGYTGLLSGLAPPPFRIGRAGFVWARFTLTDQPILIADWDGSGIANAGETEDYLLYVAETSATPEPDGGERGARMLESVTPNPFHASIRVSWSQPEAVEARVTVHDLQGRLVATLAAGTRSAGRHELEWDGRDSAGHPTGVGLYLIRVEAGGRVETTKIVRAR